MAEADSSVVRRDVSSDDIHRVEGRISEVYYSIVAAHRMCDDCISSGATFENLLTANTVLMALLRGSARDLAKCVDALEPDAGLMENFEGHFGSI
jgi:hypothetical protein